MSVSKSKQNQGDKIEKNAQDKAGLGMLKKVFKYVYA